ncbi:MAG: hypothetical protein ACRD1H_20445, partial [Vicinamibacterales bacterium]
MRPAAVVHAKPLMHNVHRRPDHTTSGKIGRFRAAQQTRSASPGEVSDAEHSLVVSAGGGLDLDA